MSVNTPKLVAGGVYERTLNDGRSERFVMLWVGPTLNASELQGMYLDQLTGQQVMVTSGGEDFLGFTLIAEPAALAQPDVGADYPRSPEDQKAFEQRKEEQAAKVLAKAKAWKDATEQEIAQMRAKGFTASQIGKHYGVHHQAVTKRKW
jgi:hypothetical protein